MAPTSRSREPQLPSPAWQVPAGRRLGVSLARALDLARDQRGACRTRQRTRPLRPFIVLALASAGLWPEPTAAAASGAAGGDRTENDPELLFTALSSLIETVKSLTPPEGQVFAQLGREASPSRVGSREERADLSPFPPSDVVLELVSQMGAPSQETASRPVFHPSGDPALELALVAGIVERKGGRLTIGPRGRSQSFTVRLPVRFTPPGPRRLLSLPGFPKADSAA
ncbi:MAG TPA: hypothetical protein VHQ90_09310 [Thermoanaerobaculia bacterium]|nr:hypothetical protein [Thermoanaerobaculia bacterium]